MRRLLFVLFFLLSILNLSRAQQMWIINTIAGGGPNNLPANGVAIGYVSGLAVDGSGNVYISDDANLTGVYKVTNGQLFRMAGAATQLAGGVPGVGGPATLFNLEEPRSVGVDAAGDIYIPDFEYVYKVDPSGIISTIAGNGTGISSAGHCVSDGDGPALQHSVCLPSQVIVDSKGNLYVSDSGDYRVRKIDPQGNMTTVAGVGPNIYGQCVFDGDGVATSVSVCPEGIALDATGNLYIADEVAYTIRKVDASGNITTIAGNGNINYSGDNGPALQAGMAPTGITLDSAGNLYIMDGYNGRVRKVDTSGTITTVAGNGTHPCTWNESGPALEQPICGEWVAIDSAGNLYVDASQFDVVDKIDTSGNLTLFAGNGTTIDSGNDISATQYSIYNPTFVATDPSGTVYFNEDTAGARKLASDGTKSWVQQGVVHGATAVDGQGNIYWATGTQIEKWDPSGNYTLIAGTSNCTFDGDGPATQHSLCGANDIVLDANGNIYAADTQNNRIRKVDTSGMMTTIAGDAGSAFDGDGPATKHALSAPAGVAVDSNGNVYVSDTDDDRVREVTVADGNMTTIAGSGNLLNGECVFDGDGIAIQHSLCSPRAITVDPSGNVFVVDWWNVRIRMISGSDMTTLAGTGTLGFYGENQPASTALLNSPVALATDPNGNVYVADQYNNRIRKISQTSTFVVSPGQPIVNVSVGGSGSVTLQVTAANGFTGTVTFACSGAPQGATCTPSPASQVVSSGSASTTFTITTTAASSSALSTWRHTIFPAWWVLGLVLIVAAASQPKRRMALGFVAAVLLIMPACGGSSSSSGGGGGGGTPTPKGSYMLTLSATSGSTTQSTTVTLNVQ